MSSQMLNRFEWFKAVMQAEDLTATSKNVAGALAIRFANNETGQINPSQETLANYLKVHKDTVKLSLRELRNGGWLLSAGNGGRGKVPMLRLISPSKNDSLYRVKMGQRVNFVDPNQRVSKWDRRCRAVFGELGTEFCVSHLFD